jgi:phenylalanyl-tRNA synthetase beta chain
MLVSIKWLGRHVDLEGLSPEQICEDLTLSTCEVEGLEPFAPHMASVRVGEVLSRERHPDADKLSLCRVAVGDAEPLQIVCGAPNVAAGQKVAVAVVGTVLPGNFKIKKSKIRGVESRGMICSVRELELGDEHDGIWVLPPDSQVGSSVAEALEIEDWVIEIDNKSLTHRPDLWGVRGIAAELGAIYDRPLKPLDLSLPEVGSDAAFDVRIETPACSRYMGLVLDNVAAGPSPIWMRHLLLAVGQRPIDGLVDLSNFVMLDLGQPNHVFELAEVPGGIVVREASEPCSFTTLDGEERALQSGDPLVCSAEQPVALAGIMGGLDSRVGETGSRRLLEVATFHPATVRRTSSRLGLRTDSSARFEKHLDPTLPAKALAHFAHLLGEWQPDVSLPAAISDCGDWTDPAMEIELSGDHVRRALGVDLADGEIRSILERLGLACSSGTGTWNVAIPSARATKDLTLSQDLVEEVGRIHRYGNVPEASLVADVVPPPSDARRNLVRRVQDRLAGAGQMHEVMSYSFQSDDLLETLGWTAKPHVEVVNPVAAGMSRVRRAVLPSLLGLLAEGRRQSDDLRIFEVGKAYVPNPDAVDGQPIERHEVALAWAMPCASPDAAFDDSRLLHLRGMLQDLFVHLELEAPIWTLDEQAPSWAHPARALVARVGDSEPPLVRLAELHPEVAVALGLEGELACDVALAEISLDQVLGAPQAASGYRPIPRFPGVKLDVAVLASEDTLAGDVQALIEKAGKGLVRDLELFDLYRGENLGQGRKSLAYHLQLQSDKRTLSDKDCAKFLDRLERALGESGAELRRS